MCVCVWKCVPLKCRCAVYIHFRLIITIKSLIDCRYGDIDLSLSTSLPHISRPHSYKYHARRIRRAKIILYFNNAATQWEMKQMDNPKWIEVFSLISWAFSHDHQVFLRPLFYQNFAFTRTEQQQQKQNRWQKNKQCVFFRMSEFHLAFYTFCHHDDDDVVFSSLSFALLLCYCRSPQSILCICSTSTLLSNTFHFSVTFQFVCLFIIWKFRFFSLSLIVCLFSHRTLFQSRDMQQHPKFVYVNSLAPASFYRTSIKRVNWFVSLWDFGMWIHVDFSVSFALSLGVASCGSSAR